MSAAVTPFATPASSLAVSHDEPGALPEAGLPEPKRQMVVATALAGLAIFTLIGTMLAVWVLLRERVVAGGKRFPIDYVITEVATNVMLITIIGVGFFATWAVSAAKSNDRANTALALGLVGLLAVAFINAQAFTYQTMQVEIRDEYYGVLFYAVTGTVLALVMAGLVFTAVTAFRVLGGRARNPEILAAHALYWYITAAAYAAVWFVVYVTK